MKKTNLCFLLIASLLLSSCSAETKPTEDTGETTKITTEKSTETSVTEETTETPETTETSISDISVSDEKLLDSFIYSSGDKSYEDYIVTSYTFSDDGKTAEMKLCKFFSYSKGEIKKMKPGKTKIKGYTVTNVEIDKDGNPQSIDVGDICLSCFLQENDNYYLGDSNYCFEEVETKTVKISSDAIITGGDYSLGSEGIMFSEDNHSYKDTNELLSAFSARNLKVNPELYVRMEDNQVKVIVAHMDDTTYMDTETRDYADYYVTDFKLSDEGLSGEFEISEIDKYTKENVESVKNINAFAKGRDTFYWDSEYYVSYNLQDNGSYYKLEDDCPYYTEAGTKEFRISPDVILIDSEYSFGENGIPNSDRGLSNKTIKDFIDVLNNYEHSGYNPELLIRVIDGEITLISINPGAHQIWVDGKYIQSENTPYEDYFVTTYKTTANGLSDEFEVAKPISYTQDEIKNFKVGKTKILNGTLSSIEESEFGTIYLTAGENDYILKPQADGNYILFRDDNPCYDDKTTMKLSISDDVVIYANADPYASGGILSEIDQYDYQPIGIYTNIDQVIDILKEREDEGYPRLFIRVTNNEISTIVIYPGSAD